MDSSQELKHRTPPQNNQEQDTTTTTTTNVKSQKKKAMAKRGLRSLALALALPLSMTLANIYMFGSPAGSGADQAFRDVSKPVWFPPLWLLHLTCVVFSLVMGLSAWLVWAQGGFHKNPMAAAMYVAQLGLSLAWVPIMFRMGASRVGLFVCLALLVSVFQCLQGFKNVNPIAGGLVKPCLAWVAFLTALNLKLVFL